MTRRLEIAASKWARNAAAAKDFWAKMVSSPETPRAYAEGVADFLGVDVGTVSASLPARNYAEFARNASAYVEAFAKGIERAARLNKWKEKYVAAFTLKR